MKILFASVITLFLFTSVYSQEFGIFGGAQATSANYKIRDSKQKTDYKFGFHLGGMMKVPFENNLYFAPAAFYSMKGYKVAFNRPTFPPDSAAIDNNTTFHNFEIAALLQLDFSNKPNHFFVKAGPSLDFQLFGKETFNRQSDPPVSRDIKFGFADYGHFSANFLAQLGYETGGGFVISGQVTLGLTNIINTDGGPQVLHNAFGISIGKYFERKKIIIDTRNRE